MFLLVPLAELALLISVGQQIGVWATLAIVVGTAFAGSLILHQQGLQALRRAMESSAAGRPPVEPVVDGAFLLFAGGLLLTPGLITDAIGFALLVPPIRRFIARRLFKFIMARANIVVNMQYGSDGTGGSPSPDNSTTIDGDYQHVDERNAGKTSDGRSPKIRDER